MKTCNLGENYFKAILDDFQKFADKNRLSAQRSLLSKKCAYCGKGYSQNITMEYCSYECFRKTFGQ